MRFVLTLFALLLAVLFVPQANAGPLGRRAACPSCQTCPGGSCFTQSAPVLPPIAVQPAKPITAQPPVVLAPAYYCLPIGQRIQYRLAVGSLASYRFHKTLYDKR